MIIINLITIENRSYHQIKWEENGGREKEKRKEKETLHTPMRKTLCCSKQKTVVIELSVYMMCICVYKLNGAQLRLPCYIRLR